MGMLFCWQGSVINCAALMPSSFAVQHLANMLLLSLGQLLGQLQLGQAALHRSYCYLMLALGVLDVMVS